MPARHRVIVVPFQQLSSRPSRYYPFPGSRFTSGRDALETAREYNLNVGVGGDNRKKENSEWRGHQQTDNSTLTKKKTFCLKRPAGFAKTKIFFYHPGLDRHGAVDVSGDLDLPRAHGRRRNPGVEFDSTLRRLVLHEPSVGDPQIRSSASGFGLPGFFLQPQPLRSLDVSTPFSRRSTTPVSAPFTVPPDLTSLTKDQRPKTKRPPSQFGLLLFLAENVVRTMVR
ncbi:hypothetical protein GEV33_014421 [Tenebrio molitor]|uniref:Uncharacterized protein n=1 Tax=Tenebrio molitor TaxID=7067 RepID=A0A8J6L4S4_TENMO|nr:hypothetical protein GEV33_014421 [Tenebrio molitor]